VNHQLQNFVDNLRMGPANDNFDHAACLVNVDHRLHAHYNSLAAAVGCAIHPKKAAGTLKNLRTVAHNDVLCAC
jgi:hypothetical protein